MKIIRCLALLSLLPFVLSAESPAIIPTPSLVDVRSGFFELTAATGISCEENAIKTAVLIREQLTKSTGFPLKLNGSGNGSVINLKIDDSISISESYKLTVSEGIVKIAAADEAGLFYGGQTLLQLMPAQVHSAKTVQGVKWRVPCVLIEDAPKYGWRSFMLDSGRQYQSLAFIKRYLNLMAYMKMNVFHWHLTEGDGWRIEIKRYPKLTSIGSKVASGKEQQGFYTQDDIREVIRYATERHIMVVPEIDVPGHSTAAMIAYPEMCCAKKAPAARGVSHHMFCGGQELTYEFIENVLSEVCDLFPAEYIHLGGDEAPKSMWKKCEACQKKIADEKLKNEHELQIYMMNRLARFLKTKGRKAICWDDVIAHPGDRLEGNIVIEWWNWRARKEKCYQAAIAQDREVICNSNYYTYLNFPVSPWSGYKSNRTFDIQTCYEKNPSNRKNLTAKEKSLVLGIGCAMWTDNGVQEYMVDRRVFPRALALSEQMWHAGDALPFDVFYKKVKSHKQRLGIMGVDYGPDLATSVPDGYKWE